MARTRSGPNGTRAATAGTRTGTDGTRNAPDGVLSLPIAALITAAVTLALGAVLLLVPSERVTGLVANAGNLAAALAATVLFARRIRDPKYGPVWRRLAIAGGLFAAAEAYWLVVENLLDKTIGALSPADVLYFAGYGLLAAAAVRAAPDRRRHLSGRLVLDFFVVFVSLSAIAWILFVHHATVGSGMVAESLVAIAYPVLDLTLLGFLIFMLRVARPVHQSRVILFGLALVLWTGADTFYAVQATHGGFTSGLPMDALWVGGYAALGLASLVKGPQRTRWSRTDGRRWANAVYLPVAVLLLVAIIDYIQAGRMDGVLFGHGILLVATMIGRQMLYNREVLQAARVVEETADALQEAQAMAHVGSWTWDPHRDEPEWSDEMYRIFGRDLERGPAPIAEALGLFTPESRPRLQEALDRVVAHGGIYQVDAEVALPDGETRTVVSRGEAVMDPDGTVRYLRGTVQDVTELRKADERARFLADLLVNVRQAVVATDMDGRVTYWGPGAERMYGWSADEVMGRDSARFMPVPERQAEALAVRERLQRRESWRGELEVNDKHGHRFWVESHINPIQDADGRLTGFIGVAQDISERRRLEDDLGFQAHLLGSIDEAVIANDMDGKITYWNRAAEQLFGWTREEAVGKPVSALLGTQQTQEPSLDADDGDEPVRRPGGDYKVRRKDGSHVFVRMVTNPLLGGGGRLEGFIAICEDVGEEREVHRRYRDLVQHAPDGVLRTTPKGALDFANPAAANLLGYDSVRQLLSEVERVTDLYVDPDDRQALLAQVRSPHPAPVETRFRRRDGSELPVEIRARLHVDADGVERIEGSFHDLTERLQAEKAEKARLENEHLKELDRTLRDFINAAAHDLNTPLTPIKLQLALVKRKHPDMPEDLQHRFDVIARNLTRMELLVQDLLDVARLEAGTLRLAPSVIDLDPLLADPAASFALPAKEAGIRLVPPGRTGVQVVADGRRVIQVLFNFVSNALKFTPAGEEIRIRTKRQGAHMRIEVQDDGPGLTPEQQARLFRPFTQVHDETTTTQKGTGLGLYISKGIVEQHQGEIGVESEGPGKGSTFWFTVPVDGTRAGAELMNAQPASDDSEE